MDRISPFNAENQTETPRYGGIHRYFSRRDMHVWQLKII